MRVEHFIAGHREAREELLLDLDATDDAVHGRQEGRLSHGYYDQRCFLPLYVFVGDELLVAYLRPTNVDVAHDSATVVKLLLKRLRQAWPLCASRSVRIRVVVATACFAGTSATSCTT